MTTILTPQELQQTIQLLTILEVFNAGKEERIFTNSRNLAVNHDCLGNLLRDYIKVKLNRAKPHHGVSISKRRAYSRQLAHSYEIMLPRTGRNWQDIQHYYVEREREQILRNRVTAENAWLYLIEQELLQEGRPQELSTIPGMQRSRYSWHFDVNYMLTSETPSVLIILNAIFQDILSTINAMEKHEWYRTKVSEARADYARIQTETREAAARAERAARQAEREEEVIAPSINMANWFTNWESSLTGTNFQFHVDSNGNLRPVWDGEQTPEGVPAPEVITPVADDGAPVVNDDFLFRLDPFRRGELHRHAENNPEPVQQPNPQRDEDIAAVEADYNLARQAQDTHDEEIAHAVAREALGFQPAGLGRAPSRETDNHIYYRSSVGGHWTRILMDFYPSENAHEDRIQFLAQPELLVALGLDGSWIREVDHGSYILSPGDTQSHHERGDSSWISATIPANLFAHEGAENLTLRFVYRRQNGYDMIAIHDSINRSRPLLRITLSYLSDFFERRYQNELPLTEVEWAPTRTSEQARTRPDETFRAMPQPDPQELRERAEALLNDIAHQAEAEGREAPPPPPEVPLDINPRQPQFDDTTGLGIEDYRRAMQALSQLTGRAVQRHEEQTLAANTQEGR